ncbi:MAG TPA: FAD-dependent oxidoreductase [Candidatus Limnocylindria bacterium]
MESSDLIIVGAGPYGLSVAAHLAAAQPRLQLRVFGEPMSFWAEHMPVGMLLRSPWVASNLSDPLGALTLDTYRSSQRLDFASPVPLESFTGYGRWFQRNAVPEVDQRTVTCIAPDSGRFTLTLADGAQIDARRVIVATGIGYFPHVPDAFAGLPVSLVSHTSAHQDLGRFAGREVLVVGAGQSALESAALLRESGATVELLARTDGIRYLHQRALLHRWPLEQILYAPPDVGPALLSQLVARPNLYRRAPRRLQDRWGPRAIRAAGAAWLKDRLSDVPTETLRSVTAAAADGDRVRLTLDDGSEKLADHVLLGTGYRVDLRRYPFLDQGLLARIRAMDGYPVLDAGFQTSVKGLHFVGAPAAWSFGPLMRFVAGADFTARAVARRVAAS